MGFFSGSFALGALCGAIIAVITSCDKTKRTIIARVMGILAAVSAQFMLFITGIPYEIILYIYRNDTYVRETGRLSVNEVIGYNWGTMFFWWSLLFSFAVFVIGIFIFNVINNRKKKYNVRGNINESE